MAYGIEALAQRAMTVEDGGVVERPAGTGSVRVAHVRPAAGAGPAVVMLPGGPGLGSVVPYRALRRRAVRRGLDVIMMEHRGVGLSRRLTSGRDVDQTAVTIEAAADDLAAVLDARRVDRAVIYGTSYGSYLAQAFSVRHPARVAALVLDSPMLSPADDLAMVRAFRRARFWDGDGRLASLVRAVAAADPIEDVSHVVQIVHEFAGPVTLDRLLTARLHGRASRVWRRLAALGSEEVVGSGSPLVMEPDLMRRMTHRDLGFSHAPDGLPLDPSELFARLVPDAPAFAGDPFDAAGALSSAGFPVAVISGDRDLRTPRPVAERIVQLAPDAVLVPLATTGHSAFDTHQLAALTVARAVAAGRTAELPDLAHHLSALPRRGHSALLGPMISAGLTVDRLVG